ncbi:protein msta isoform X2 [Eurytemora carolleeae]|uniref:protein msta isoform X2 n=1 Tax=Eurytemora carolleeae TaxID=1294199 RepID=UPI000C780F37|nr:protein msta isoform X2 [Eurytemora carolleeae]|eukprot:XP_023336775.1 protein msta-like isoform X2 [Eurytemora affinis]
MEAADLYLSRDISNKHLIEIKNTEDKGRCLVAKTDIGAGEIIFKELSLVCSPSPSSPPTCLTCSSPVTGSYPCPNCGWPMCNKKCALNPVHANQECALYRKCQEQLDISTWDFTEVQPLYAIIPVLRILCLPPNLRKLHSAMQNDLADWRNDSDFCERFQSAVDYLASKLNVGLTTEEIWRIFAGSVTNDFSHSHSQGRELGCVFPLAALMNHSCWPNIFRSSMETDKGAVMTVSASRKIQKGEEIFNSYIDILQPTILRSILLKQTKQFQCRCVRCEDDLDLGLNGNAVICPFCVKGTCLPSSTVQCSTVQTWACTSCSKTIPIKKMEEMIIWIDEKLKKVLSSSPQTKISKLEKFITEYSKKLGGQNMVIIRAKYNLIGMYGRLPGFTQQEMTEAAWRRKIVLCEEILQVLKVLEPGLTTRKGRIMFELYLPLAMVGQLILNKDKSTAKKMLQRSLVTLKLVIQILGREPAGTWEYRTANDSQQNVEQLQELINSLG